MGIIGVEAEEPTREVSFLGVRGGRMSQEVTGRKTRSFEGVQQESGRAPSINRGG